MVPGQPILKLIPNYDLLVLIWVDYRRASRTDLQVKLDFPGDLKVKSRIVRTRLNGLDDDRILTTHVQLGYGVAWDGQANLGVLTAIANGSVLFWTDLPKAEIAKPDGRISSYLGVHMKVDNNPEIRFIVEDKNLDELSSESSQ